MFGDLDWPPNASRRFVNISWASCYLRDAISVALATASWLGRLVAGWLAGCHTPVLYVNGLTYLKTFSIIWQPHHPSFLRPLRRYRIPQRTTSGGRGVQYAGHGRIGDFRTIFDGPRRLYRKRCEIGRWLLWDVSGKSWVQDVVL